jgi:hypothetical protein
MADAVGSDEAALREEAVRREGLIGRIGAAIGAVDWDAMTRVQRAALLERAVDWDGFDAAERFDAIENVLQGKDRSRWLEGIETRTERDAREDAIWAEAARRGNGSPNSEPYIRREWISFAQESILDLKRTEDFVRLDNGYVFSEGLDRPEGAFQRLGAWDQLEERDKLVALMMSEAAQSLRGDDMRALFMREIDFTQVPKDAQREWLGEVYHDAPARGTAPADARERLVADFAARVEGLRRDGVPAYPPLGNTLPWEQATEERKLENIVWESMIVRLEAESFDPGAAGPRVISLPGAVALEAVERHVDYAGLPAAQRELLQDLRAGLDTGRFNTPPSGHRDLLVDGLGRVVGVGHLEGMLQAAREGEGRSWAGRPEAEKVKAIVGQSVETAAPGGYTLAMIEREVDYSGLPPWRREALEGLRDRLDRGEFGGGSGDRLDLDGRADAALRLAELEARVEDEKRLGAPDRDGKRWPWRELTEEQKLGEIEMEIAELHLGSEPKAYDVISREADMSRVPEERRRAFEEGRLEAQETRAITEYDAAVVEMTREGSKEVSGLARAWQAGSERERLGLLAKLAMDHGVDEEVFVRRALRVMGWREPTAAQREALANAWAYAEGVGMPSPEGLGKLHAEWRRDGALRAMPDFRADAFESLMTRLEAFGDEFARLARTEEQRALAGKFGEFVGEANDTIACLAGPYAVAGPGRLPSPGEIAAGNDGTAPAAGRGEDQGRHFRDYARALLDRFRGAAGRIFAREVLPPPSPGDIAEQGGQAPAPEPGRGKGRGR